MVNETMGAEKSTAPMSTYYEELYEADIYPAISLLSRALAPTFNPEMDILLPTYGKLMLTLECINSIYNNTQTPFHLIVLNADAKDDFGLTHQWMLEFQKTHPNMTYCHRKRDWKEGNQFFNLGLKYCQTEYVVTCMNSMTVEPYWEMAGLQIIKNDPQIGSVGFKCLFPDGQIESAGIMFNGIMPVDFGRDESGWRHSESKVEMPCIQWAFALHRKKALVGNLEEDVFNGHVGWDDIDNNMCVRAKGWKVVYCGQGVGIHKPRSTRGSNSVEAFLANQFNCHTFYKRWGLWERYLEGVKMDVANLIKPESKAALSDRVIEYQVLQNLLNQSNKTIQALSNEVLKELGADVEKFVLEMNPANNTWNLKARTELKPIIDLNDTKILPVKHDIAGDTKNEPVEAKV